MTDQDQRLERFWNLSKGCPQPRITGWSRAWKNVLVHLGCHNKNSLSCGKLNHSSLSCHSCRGSKLEIRVPEWSSLVRASSGCHFAVSSHGFPSVLACGEAWPLSLPLLRRSLILLGKDSIIWPHLTLVTSKAPSSNTITSGVQASRETCRGRQFSP